MGIMNEKLVALHSYFKFNELIINEIKNCKIESFKEKKKITSLCKKIKKLRAPPIPNDTIKLFYDNPNDFFASYEQLLEKTSFFDDSENSIFAHYFYILHDLYKKNNLGNNDNIYEINFNSFFTKEAKYLSIQDYYLDTPLHKLAKFNDKKFFLYICKKLKEINILTEEILLINNTDEKSCFNYILQDIRKNKIKIIKNDFKLYEEFINYFPNIITNSLSLEDRKFIVTFTCLMIFEEQNWNKIDFNDTIKGFYTLKEKNSDILNIFQILYYPNQSNLNYLNCLYNTCKDLSDFDKLFQLIVDITNIKMNNEEKLCLADHISYVLGKMNSTKLRGNTEINYGIQLINKIIPLLIKDENNENIINIISVRKIIKKNRTLSFVNKGICNSLIYNQNISFEQKYEIVTIFKNILDSNFEELINKDFLYLYKLFESYNKNEINEKNINSLFNEHIFIQKIFADFSYIGKLYREVYETWKIFGHISINEYISCLNEFINKNYMDIFGDYKIRYGLPDDKIQIIARLIIAYEKQNYSNETENELISKIIILPCRKHYQDYTESLYTKFMLSKPKLANILLYRFDIDEWKEQKKKKKVTKENQRKEKDFLTSFFSFQYEYKMIFKDEKIIKIFEEKTFLRNKQLKLMFKNSLILVKDKPYEYSYYKFILENLNLYVLFQVEISALTSLLKRYLNDLVINWKNDFDFSDLKNLINENLACFCFLFLNADKSFREIGNIKNFFYDEFINLLEPNFKEKFSIYKNLADEFFDFQGKNYFGLDNKCNLSLMLIFVRLKFGKYNPKLLIMFILYYYDNIGLLFNSFITSYLQTEVKEDILYHYFFIETEFESKDDYKIQLPNLKYLLFKKNNNKYINYDTLLFKYISIFFSKYLHKFKKIEKSFVFNYINLVLDKLFEKIHEGCENKSLPIPNDEKLIFFDKEFDIKDGNEIFNIKPELYKSIILSIDKNQNERIYNLIKTLFFYEIDNQVSLYSFLEIEPGEFNAGQISHNIKILKKVSNDLIEQSKSFKNDDIENFLLNIETNDNTLLNLYRLLDVLKIQDDCLLNCVKGNKFLVFYTFFVLLKNYYYCLKKIFGEDKNKFPTIEEQYNLIFEEIINFVKFNNINENDYCDHNNNLNLSRCLLYITNDSNFNSVYYKLVTNIEKIRSQIFYIPNGINIKEIVEIVNKDALVFIPFIINMFNNYNEEQNRNNADFDEIRGVILFIFEYFLSSINPDLKNKYSLFKKLYNDIVSIESNMNNSNKSMFFNDEHEFRFPNYFQNKYNYIYFCFVMIYIYFKKTYNSYSPYILLYLYTNNKDKFFHNLTKCLSDSRTQSSIEKNLFIDNQEKNDIQLIEKGKKFNKNNILKKIKIFLSKYLIDLSLSENSFIHKYIEENTNSESDEDYLQIVIFNYSLPEEINANKLNRTLYNNILKIFSSKFTFYGFLKEDYTLNIINKERMAKKIIIIENLINYSLNNNITMINKEYFDKFIPKEYFMNLYLFLYNLKNQNKKLLNFAKNNNFFLNETINVFANVYDILKNSLILDYNTDKEIKEKIEFVLVEIKTFFDDLIHDNIKNKLLSYEIKDYQKISNILIEFTLYYNKNFYEQISNGKLSIVDIKKKFKDFKNIIELLFSHIKQTNEIGSRGKSSTRIKRKLIINDFCHTLCELFKHNLDIFYSFLKSILENFNASKKGDKINIFISIMKTDIEKFFGNLGKINSNISNLINFDLYQEIDSMKTISYIINNSDFNIFSKIDLINNSSIYNNKQKSFILLSKINNQKGSLFIYKKIQHSFQSQNNSERFIEFINNTINNNFIFDNFLSILSENELKSIFTDNQKDIISSLFRYSTLNAYYITKKLLEQLSKYMTKNEFQTIIYDPKTEPVVSASEYNLEDIIVDEEKKYLLSHSLSVKTIKNYETIAVILSFCQYPEGILQLFYFLHIGLDLNFSHFRSFSFFSNIDNIEKIKELEINFYNFIILAKSIIDNNNIIVKLTDMEKFIFNNMIKIFIFDITPRELMLLTDDKIPRSKVKNISEDENKLFALLTLFEIKGLPILPIKKYFPSFYLKIEELFYKYKSLIKINQICLKQPSDVKLYESLKQLLNEKNASYIIENFPFFNNLLTIFLLEGKQDFSLELHNEKMTSIYKLIIDLINDINTVPFYDNNKNYEFFTSIFSINEKQIIDINLYKILIDSLLDFHQTSHIIIQNNESQKMEYKWKNKNKELNVYISYLEALNNICRYVIFYCDENKGKYRPNYFTEELSRENKNRINNLKNSIDLNKIILYIIHQLDNSNDNNDGFTSCIKSWINNLIKDSNLLNNSSKEKTENILSYFQYLNKACFILLKILNQINTLKEVKAKIDKINNSRLFDTDIHYYYNINKEYSKKCTKESLYKLGKKILKIVKPHKYIDVEGGDNISIYFNFNGEKEEFVETFTESNLIKFIKDKIDSISEFIKKINKDDFILMDEELTMKEMDQIFDELCLSINNESNCRRELTGSKLVGKFKKSLNSEINDNRENVILELFNSFLSKNHDFICKYLEDTAFDVFQPNYDDYKFLINHKLRNIIFSYIHPCIRFNQELFNFCQNNYFHNYIDFTDLISSIRQTKFHSNDDLNSKFQLEAINYLIYGNSNLFLFIFDLFDRICKKSEKKHINEIKECFKIKIEQGGKSHFEQIMGTKNNSEYSEKSSIISSSSLTGKKLKLKLKVSNFINSKNKMFFSIVSLNTKKREIVPIINSSIYIPISKNNLGTTIGNISKNVFTRKIIIHDKNEFSYQKGKNIHSNYNKDRKNIKFINVFEYIFTIISVDNEKIIHLCQNDISEILSNYSAQNDFNSLLNNNGFIEKNWKINFDLDDIEISYKCP